MKKIALFVLGFTVLTLSQGVKAEPPVMNVGQPFPDIAFPSMEDGSPMSIADFRGKKVILHVFASW